MKYAYIESGKVVEVARVNPFGIFHEDYASKFVEVPNEVEPGWLVDGAGYSPAPAPPAQSQFEKDQSRYAKRAEVKDELMAYMAADNMGRVRSGVWSVADLTALLDDPAVVAANALMGTLSFELAAQQIQNATTPLLTPEIKADWTSRLEAHYYLAG